MKDCYQLVKIKKSDLINEGWLRQKEFEGLWPKFYSYLIDYTSSDKKAKGIKICLIKQRLKFKNYKKCLKSNGNILRSQKKKKKKKKERKKERKRLKVQCIMYLLKTLTGLH